MSKKNWRNNDYNPTDQSVPLDSQESTDAAVGNPIKITRLWPFVIGVFLGSVLMWFITTSMSQNNGTDKYTEQLLIKIENLENDMDRQSVSFNNEKEKLETLVRTLEENNKSKDRELEHLREQLQSFDENIFNIKELQNLCRKIRSLDTFDTRGQQILYKDCLRISSN